MTYIPSVHMNGTSFDELCKQQRSVIDAISEAIAVHRKAAPHGRDYYVQEPGAYDKAMTEFGRTQNRLIEIQKEMTTILAGIIDQKPIK